MYGSRLTGSFVVLFSAAVLLAQPAAADLEEIHDFHFRADNPVPGTTYQYSVDVPLFDTQGGARTLTSFRVDYMILSYYRYDINANPDSRYHGCEVSWHQDWTSKLNGATYLPMDQPNGMLDAGNSVGEISAPYTPSWTGFSVPGSGTGHTEREGAPELLARMMGTGTATIQCTDALSPITVAPPDAHHAPPGMVFDPGLLTVYLDAISVDVTLTYYYTPEPGSLSLLGLLTLLLRRR
jgi:hypothetical protein